MCADADSRGPDINAAHRRLLDAAERLIALEGVAISDREIVRASGHRNNSAIAYHFKGRNGLVTGVYRRRTSRIGERRAALLAGREPEDLDRQTLLEYWIHPLTDEMAALEHSYWARFLHRMLEAQPLDFLTWVHTDPARAKELDLGGLAQVLARLRDLTGADDQDIAGTRIGLMARFVVGALAAWERDVEADRMPRPLPAFRDDLVRLAGAMLDTPLH